MVSNWKKCRDAALTITLTIGGSYMRTAVFFAFSITMRLAVACARLDAFSVRVWLGLRLQMQVWLDRGSEIVEFLAATLAGRLLDLVHRLETRRRWTVTAMPRSVLRFSLPILNLSEARQRSDEWDASWEDFQERYTLSGRLGGQCVR